MAGMNDAIAMALMQAGNMVPRNQRDPYAQRKKAAMAALLQGMRADPVQGGIGEGVSRALTGLLGGVFLGKANRDQEAEDTARRDALVSALTPQMGPDGKPLPFNPSAVAATLARQPGYEGLAASLMFANMADDRNRSQARSTMDIITGGPSPVGAPPGMPTGMPPGTMPQAGGQPGGQYNVGNILAPGRTPGPGAWRTFDTPEAAVAGVKANLLAYPGKFNGGQPMSILQIAPYWSKGVSQLDADSQAWARNVAVTAGIDPNQPIDFNDPAVMARIAKGIHVAEFGQGALYPDDVYMRGVSGGQPQAAAQPPVQVAGPPMAPPAAAPPVANPPQSPAPPQAPPMPAPLPLGAAPPQMPGQPPMVDDSGEGQPGMAPGFANPPTVRLPPVTRLDDGSRELEIYQRFVNTPNLTPQQMQTAMEFYKLGMDKRVKAQQAQADAASKEPPMIARTDAGGVANVEGALEAMRAQAAAKAAGSAVGGGVLQPGTDPNTGAPGQVNPVTGEFKPAAAPFNDTQGKVATFADRMAASERNLREVEGAGTSVVGSFLERLGGAGNFLQSPEYQRYEQARRDFINAVLRRESGAVIAPDEFSNAEKQYFPRPGDTPQVIEQKRRNRQIAIDGMVRDAGPAYRPRQDAPQGDATLDQARDAIKRGAPRDKVIERLRSMGIDPGGL